MAITASRRPARVEIEASSRGMDKGLRDARRKLKSFHHDEGRQSKSRSKGEKGGLLGGIAKLAAGGAVAGFIANVGEEVFNVEKALTRFQIATNKTPEQLNAFRTELGKVSKETGLSRDQLVSGAAAYVALTGDAEGSTKAMALFGKVANATGASMDDIAATAAAMKFALKIDPKDFEAGFSALSVQGKAGAVEIRELAKELAGVAPSFAQFSGGTGAAGLIEMGAALQVVRKGFGSTAEAATGLQSLMVSLVKHADKFKAVGVRVFSVDKKGKQSLRDFSDIIDDIGKSKLANNKTALTKAFGRDEARRAYDQIIANRALMDDLIAKGGDVNSISRDAAIYQQSSAGKIEEAWNSIKLSVAEAFTPERIEKFAVAMQQAAAAVEKMVAGVEWMLGGAKSAGEGLAKLIGGEKLDYNEQTAREDQAALDKRVNRAKLINKGMSTEGARSYVKQEDSLTSGYRAMASGQGEGRSVQQLQSEFDAVKNRLGSYTDPQALLWAIQAAMKRANSPEGIANAMTAALVRTGFGVSVKVGAEPIAKASSNSPSHRTRAGGV